MCLNHVGGWFSKTQRDKKFDPGYWIKLLEPPWYIAPFAPLHRFSVPVQLWHEIPDINEGRLLDNLQTME